MTRLIGLLALLGAGLLAFGSSPAAAQVEGAGQRCSQLANVDFSGIVDAPSHVTEATLVAARDGTPAFCQVTGYSWPQVGFQIALPVDGWNEKFLESGCGGFCGRMMDWYCRSPVAHGYACVATDLGHRSVADNPLAGSFSGLWAYNNLQAQVDHGFRGAHAVALAGKAIATRFYARAPRRAYFMGCSDGGREALNEAQRFPEDFDGIVAGAPASNYSATFASQLWNDRLAFRADRTPLFDAASIKLVGDAVRDACDMNDGVKDGLIGDPQLCRFDPARLACGPGKTSGCLASDQVAALDKLYKGPVDASGNRIMAGGLSPGVPLGRLYVPGSLGRTRAMSYVEEFLRYFGLTGPSGERLSPADFDIARDYARLRGIDALMSATNPDLRNFAGRKGKLILYHGWDDSLISPYNTVDYYETVERTMGGPVATREFARLFMVPAMDHCALGPGAWDIDFLSALDQWVDSGIAPDSLIGANIALPPDPTKVMAAIGSFPVPPTSIRFTRPIYPYPLRAKFKKGDPAQAASFIPTR